MSLLPKNLKWLRIHRDVNQHFIADLVSRKANTISNWENGVAEPSISDLLIMSSFFGISVDLMLTSDLAKTVSGKEGRPYTYTYKKALDLISETVVGEFDSGEHYNRSNELEKRLDSIDRRLESITGKLDTFLKPQKATNKCEG